MNAIEVYVGSDGELTKRYYALLCVLAAFAILIGALSIAFLIASAIGLVIHCLKKVEEFAAKLVPRRNGKVRAGAISEPASSAAGPSSGIRKQAGKRGLPGNDCFDGRMSVRGRWLQ